MPVVFLSHAMADKLLIDALYDLLQTGCDLRRDQVACTSVEGAGITTGEEFVAWIDEHLASASLVVLVLGPNYYASKFCLAEMGAAWALKKDVFPIMLPSTPRDPGVVFLGRQSARLDETGLDDLRDRIAKHAPEAGASTARWSIKRDGFAKSLSDLLESLPLPEVVERAQLEKQEQLTAAAVNLYNECELKTKALGERIALLEQAKDPEDVRRINAQLTPAIDRYRQLARTAHLALEKLNRVEVRALYAFVAADEWVPGRTTWDYWEADLEKAVKSKWVFETEHYGRSSTYVGNGEHPRYAEVVELLTELGASIDEVPEEVKGAMESEQGYLLDVGNWQYWEEELVGSPLLE